MTGDAAAAWIAAATTPSPAGRFLVRLPGDPSLLPPAPARVMVVHLESDEAGFRVPTRPSSTPADVAAVIAACAEWRGRPVILAPSGATPVVLLSVLTELATRLGVPVACPQLGGVAVSPGRLHTVAPLVWAHPLAAPGHTGFVEEPDPKADQIALEPQPATPPPLPGPVLAAASSPPPDPVAEVEPPTAAPQERPVQAPREPLADESDKGRGDGGPTRVGAVGTATTDPPATPGPTPIALVPWRALGPGTAEDRPRLRAAIGWRYQAHARAVTQVLAMHPGLRLGIGADELLAGLVSARAYLSPEGRLVDVVLRGGVPDLTTVGSALHSPEDAAVLARCAMVGMRRLPALLGPVHRIAKPGVTAAAYIPGDVVVEPAFLQVSASRPDPTEGGLAYVIWSRTGRRTDLLTATEENDPGGVFVPGTRFLVLAVEENQPDRSTTVLLAEAPPGRVATPEENERTLARLREAAQAATTPKALQFRHPDIAVGLADTGVPFAADPTAADHDRSGPRQEAT